MIRNYGGLYAGNLCEMLLLRAALWPQRLVAQLKKKTKKNENAATFKFETFLSFPSLSFFLAPIFFIFFQYGKCNEVTIYISR